MITTILIALAMVFALGVDITSFGINSTVFGLLVLLPATVALPVPTTSAHNILAASALTVPTASALTVPTASALPLSTTSAGTTTSTPRVPLSPLALALLASGLAVVLVVGGVGLYFYLRSPAANALQSDVEKCPHKDMDNITDPMPLHEDMDNITDPMARHYAYNISFRPILEPEQAYLPFACVSVPSSYYHTKPASASESASSSSESAAGPIESILSPPAAYHPSARSSSLTTSSRLSTPSIVRSSSPSVARSFAPSVTRSAAPSFARSAPPSFARSSAASGPVLSGASRCSSPAASFATPCDASCAATCAAMSAAASELWDISYLLDSPASTSSSFVLESPPLEHDPDFLAYRGTPTTSRASTPAFKDPTARTRYKISSRPVTPLDPEIPARYSK